MSIDNMSELGKVDFNGSVFYRDRFKSTVEFLKADSYPKENFVIRPFIFKDENEGKSDGCIFDIGPYGRTHFVEIIKSDVEIEEIPISGSGYLVKKSPNKPIEIYEFKNIELQSFGVDVVQHPGDIYMDCRFGRYADSKYYQTSI
jgi:hypothetical protein